MFYSSLSPCHACRCQTCPVARRQGDVLVTNELARRVSDKNIVAISLHPGNIYSSPDAWNIVAHIFMRPFVYDIAYGVISPLYAGTAPAATELNGKVVSVADLGMCVNAADDWLVLDHVGTRNSSKREGTRCGASEEVMGLVRGPSKGIVMLQVIGCAHYWGITP